MPTKIVAVAVATDAAPSRKDLHEGEEEIESLMREAAVGHEVPSRDRDIVTANSKSKNGGSDCRNWSFRSCLLLVGGVIVLLMLAQVTTDSVELEVNADAQLVEAKVAAVAQQEEARQEPSQATDDSIPAVPGTETGSSAVDNNDLDDDDDSKPKEEETTSSGGNAAGVVAGADGDGGAVVVAGSAGEETTKAMTTANGTMVVNATVSVDTAGETIMTMEATTAVEAAAAAAASTGEAIDVTDEEDHGASTERNADGKETVIVEGTEALEVTGPTSGRDDGGGETEDAEGGGEGAEKEEEPSSSGAITDDYSENERKGFRKPASYRSDKYLRRANPAVREGDEPKRLAEKWGEWTFVDPDPSLRPNDDFYAVYPNRDVPREEFPSGAWQTDHAYLESFLSQGVALVDRALEAILGEYGHSKYDEPNKTFEERSVMFSLRKYNLSKGEKPQKKKTFQDGGWSTGEDSFRGIVRRCLHAVMTEDTFVFAMGGHSAAAAHGNHFWQSYTHVVGETLEPVFARLGVTHESRNFGMGGLGTIQNALGMGDLYGRDIDILRWDSGMTEGGDHRDVFVRQGLLSGDKVPALWGGGSSYHVTSGVEVLEAQDWGYARLGLPLTKDTVQVQDLPYWAQFLECTSEMKKVCRGHAYQGTCWIDRDDVPRPPKVNKAPGGRVKWHPGNREHRLKGRGLAFQVLRALKEALLQWQRADDYALPDDAWHVTRHYEEIRRRVRAVRNSDCFKQGVVPAPDYVCNHGLQARSEFTPRYNPAATSIRSLLHRSGQVDAPGLQPRPNYYDPPDVRNPAMDVPPGEVDYLAIVENGIDFAPNRLRPWVRKSKPVKENQQLGRRRRAHSLSSSLASGEVQPPEEERHRHRGLTGAVDGDDKIVPGLGWHLSVKTAPDNCDGLYDSFCGRGGDNDCMLYGHNDGRGGLMFDGFSGWLVMTLSAVRRGLIMIKMEDWHKPGSNPETTKWSCENGAKDCEARARFLLSNRTDHRALDEAECEKNWRFQFAINGKITEWNMEQFKARKQKIQRVVSLWVLLDDPDFLPSDGSNVDVELALRLKGCRPKQANTLVLSHVYWA